MQSRYDTMRELEEVKKVRSESYIRSEFDENIMENNNTEKMEKPKPTNNYNTSENFDVKCVRFDETKRETSVEQTKGKRI